MAFSVTAAGGLGDGVESCKGAEDDGEVDIDTGFDELGGDEADGEFFTQAAFDEIEGDTSVGGAHQGGEVKAGAIVGEEFEEFPGMAAGVNDREGPGVLFDEESEGGVVGLAREAVGVDSTEGGIEFGRFGNDFVGGFEADLEVWGSVNGRLAFAST